MTPLPLLAGVAVFALVAVVLRPTAALWAAWRLARRLAVRR